MSYINSICESQENPIIISGHSKGGNLAHYAGSKCSYPHRISAIYAFDALGLHDKILNSQSYQNTLQKIKTFRPQSSLVATLFEDMVTPTIVKSNGIGLMQHFMFLWQTDLSNNCFVSAKKVSYSSLKFKEVMHSYLASSNSNENRSSINFVYKALMNRSEGVTLWQRLKIFISLLYQASKQEKQAIIAVLLAFLSSLKSSDIRSHLNDYEQARTSRLFLNFFYFSEQISYRSKWLALLTSIVLFYSTFILSQLPHLNLLIFSFLFLLALFMAGLKTFKSWFESTDKLSFHYLPGIFSLFILCYDLFHMSQFYQILPYSIIYILLMWSVYLIYQSYKISPHLPKIGSGFIKLGLLGMIFALLSLIYPAFMDFFVDKGILIVLLYKAVISLFIAYRLFNNRLVKG